MNELKPCPFCGGKARLDYTNDNKHRPYVHCLTGILLKPMCTLSHVDCWQYKTETEAIEAWNRRVNEVSE
jgi:Lar family restriction alleviation protein